MAKSMKTSSFVRVPGSLSRASDDWGNFGLSGTSMRAFPGQMVETQQVTFRFGRDTEVHYLERLPREGDRVALGRELWVVTSVDSDEVGVVVVCERRSPDVSGDAGTPTK
jgi:hypothetical protein